jgi:hypothetical protein
MAGRALGQRRQRRGERRWGGQQAERSAEQGSPLPQSGRSGQQHPPRRDAGAAGPARAGSGCAAGIGSGLTDDTAVLLSHPHGPHHCHLRACGHAAVMIA